MTCQMTLTAFIKNYKTQYKYESVQLITLLFYSKNTIYVAKAKYLNLSFHFRILFLPKNINYYESDF